MNSTGLGGGFWPTSQQQLLLRAALLQEKKALDAWQEWKESIDLDHLDGGSLRLLPLLHRNLRQYGVEDALMGRFKGIHRLTWYRNHGLFRNMAGVVRSLQDVGLPTMVLKGAALIAAHYRDYGLRPVGDVDVLVPTKDASAALDLLTNSGWSPRLLKPPEVITDRYLAHRHGVVLRDSADQHFDLHWHVLADSCGADADKEFWEGAVEVSLEDLSMYALNPTDQLLHVCTHGARWASQPELQWAADAMTVMRTAQPQVEWPRLLALVEKHRLALPLRDTLTYLRDVLEAPIPSGVLQSLHEMPVSELERLEYEARTSPWAARNPWQELRSKYLRYSLLMHVAGRPANLVGFPEFLMHTWGLQHWWQLPLSVVRRTAYRVEEMSDWYGGGAGERSPQG